MKLSRSGRIGVWQFGKKKYMAQGVVSTVAFWVREILQNLTKDVSMRARDRECGSLDHHATFEGGITKLDTVPWCFINKASLHKEIENIVAKDESDQIFTIITKSRDCPSWYPWREFATPKEHFEESMMLAMEKRREEFEQRMEQERKDFELRLQELNKEERKRSNRVMIWLAIGAIIFAAAQIYAALAAINPDHWLFRWLR